MTGTVDDLLRAAAEIVERDGVEGLTTRAVCQAAGVTAPTLYHHFGDKDGLVRALVAQGVRQFMAHKRAHRRTDDPLADFRRGWEGWIAFAFERPRLFQLMAEASRSDPALGREAFALMRGNLERLAQQGLLAADLDDAARTVWAASSGLLALFQQGISPRDIRQSSRLLYEALTARLMAPGRLP